MGFGFDSRYDYRFSAKLPLSWPEGRQISLCVLARGLPNLTVL